MTSTPNNGETEQRDAEQTPSQTNISNETLIRDAGESAEGLRTDAVLQDHDDDSPYLDQPELNTDGGTQDTAFLELHTAVGRVSKSTQDDQDTTSIDDVPKTPDRVLGQFSHDATGGLYSPSNDDNASIPDDTLSIQGPFPSSPRNGVSPQPPSSRKGGTPKRPFDLRFQSRLSSTSLLSPRASSPAFLTSHSRQSSLASQGFLSASEVDESEAPWEVIRWHRLTKTTNQIFSEAARRNFGNPTCLAVSDHVVIGTSKGLILIFDHSQNHKAIIGSGSPAAEAGSVTSLAISADHTTVAAGYATGHIFTWEIARASRPFLHIPPTDNNQPMARTSDGHVDGSIVLHIGFLGFRRTALVSADDRGMAFSHLATRGTGSLGRAVHTTRVLGRYPELVIRSVKPAKKSSVLAFGPLPLGNVEQSTDSLGLVAMLTPYLLVIVSTTPIAQTQHKAARPKEITAHSAMTAALAWFPAIKLKGADKPISRTKLVYAWSDVLTVLEVHEIKPAVVDEKERPPELQFSPRSRYKAEEAVVAVQWLSRSVLAVLTITQQLLIIEDNTMTVTDAFDLLAKDLYHADVYSHQLQSVIENLDDEDSSMHGVVADAFHMSFKAYKGRLFLLGQKNIWWGSLTNWADRLLAMMDAGDFIGAIRLATNYFAGVGEKLTIGLPEDDQARHKLVREKLMEMSIASLKYAFGKNEMAEVERLNRLQLKDLAVACVNACLVIEDHDFLFEEVFSWYDDHNEGPLFVEVLEPAILDGKIRSLPPTALKTLINHFKTTHSSAKLEEVICLLDASAMDLDQVTSLCKQNGLYDAYIYVWNSALMDYVSPLKELLEIILKQPKMNGYFAIDSTSSDVVQKLFAYLSFTLTGRVYPTAVNLNEDTANNAKTQIYDFLFAGTGGPTSTGETSLLREASSSSSFPQLRTILKLDTASFMRVMNEAFEDTFLNTGSDEDLMTSPGGTTINGIYNRQFLIQILLGVMSTEFDSSQTVYLDMFIARNLPKYPQYILLSGSTLHETFMRLCAVSDENLQDDAQLSVEYLLSVYQPPDPLGLVPLLQKAHYYRVLKSIFRQEQQFADLLKTYLVDENSRIDVFDVIVECLRTGAALSIQQQKEVAVVVKDNASELADIDTSRSALVIDDVLSEAHLLFLDALSKNPRQQFRYLRTLLEPSQPSRVPSENLTSDATALYVQLMCRYDAGHVVDYVKSLKEADLKLDAVIPAMEASGVVDATIILLAKHGQIRDAMDRLLKHLNSVRAVLTGLLQTSADTAGVSNNNEATDDLLESIDRYTGVGIWICQGQTGKHPRVKVAAKSPRGKTPAAPLSFGEQLWLDLLLAVVSVAQDITTMPTKEQLSQTTSVAEAVRTTIQKLFTALLSTTTARREGSAAGSDLTFLRILRAFLTGAAESSPSLSALRSVISSIFSAYAYEESLLALSNNMLDKDLFVHVEEVSKLRQVGWRPRGQVCEICKRRVWGPSTGLQIWKAWEIAEAKRKEQSNLAPPPTEEVDLSRGKGKATVAPPAINSEDLLSESSCDPPLGPLIVFSCRHLYHRACLQQSQNPDGQSPHEAPSDATHYRCPLCP